MASLQKSETHISLYLGLYNLTLARSISTSTRSSLKVLVVGSQFRQVFALVDELYVLMLSNIFLRLTKHGDFHELVNVLLKDRTGLLSHLCVEVDVGLHPRVQAEF